jgi:hypothetical protein
VNVVDLANFATDADGDALTFTINTQNTDASVVTCSIASGSVLKCDLNGLGTTTLVAIVSDGQATDTVTITINVFDDNTGGNNNAPVFSGNSLYYSFDLALGNVNVVDFDTVAFDADGDALTYTINTASTDGSIVTCQVVGTSLLNCNLNNVGTTSFTATANDGQATDTIPVVINVFQSNTPPVFNVSSTDLIFTYDLAQTTQENVLNIANFVSDVDGDSLTYSIDTSATDSAVTQCNLFASTVNCLFTGVGSTTFQAQASDSQSTANVQVTIIVADSTPVNNAPFYVNLQTVEVEASGMQFIFDLQANSIDPDGDAVTNDFTLGSTNPNIINYCMILGSGQLYCNVIGEGQTQITISVTDGIDTTFDVLPIIATQVPNNPPVFNGNLQGFYSYEITLENVDVVDLASVVSDADGDALTYTLDQSNTDTSIVSCQLNSASVLNCDLNGIGTTTVSVSVSDGVDMITAQLTINVYPGPLGPVAIISSPGDRIVCEEGESITFNGDQSFSPDNTPLVNYYWTVVDLAGNVVAQNNAATWTLNDCFDEGRYTVYLSVVDANNLVGNAEKLIRTYDEEDFTDTNEEGLKVSSVEAWGVDFEVADLTDLGGYQLELIAVVENQNDFDIDDLRMTYTIPEYGVKYRSVQYDIESGDMTTISMVIDLPFDIEPGVYYPTFSFSDGELRRVKPSYLEILG